MKHLTYIIFSFALCLTNLLQAQDAIRTLTLDEVISIAQEQSIQSMIAKQTMEQNYWEYRAYKAEMLPSISLSLTPYKYYHALDRVYNKEGRYESVDKNEDYSDVILGVSQNLPATGGRFSLMSGLNYTKNYQSDTSYQEFTSNPYISFSQPITGYNPMKWKNRLQPKRFEISKRQFIQSQEDVSIKAINLFFDLCIAQLSMDISNVNYQNADTLYKISQGRFEIGKISENELLQMELSYLNSKTGMNDALIQMNNSKQQFKSFLGFNDDMNIELIVPDSIPDINITLLEVKEEALKNNPEMLEHESSLIEAERNVMEKRSEKNLNIQLDVKYGINRQDAYFPDIITNKDNITSFQDIVISLEIPILDWGVKKGYYKMAKINQDITKLQVKQALNDFEQMLINKVMHFNLQPEQVEISKKSEVVAQKKYEVIKQRFLIGKVDVIELNVAQRDKDNEKVNRLNAIRTYWESLYELRKITLFDFVKKESFLEKLENSEEFEFTKD